MRLWHRRRSGVVIVNVYVSISWVSVLNNTRSIRNCGLNFFFLCVTDNFIKLDNFIKINLSKLITAF